MRNKINLFASKLYLFIIKAKVRQRKHLNEQCVQLTTVVIVDFCVTLFREMYCHWIAEVMEKLTKSLWHSNIKNFKFQGWPFKLEELTEQLLAQIKSSLCNKKTFVKNCLSQVFYLIPF